MYISVGAVLLIILIIILIIWVKNGGLGRSSTD